MGLKVLRRGGNYIKLASAETILASGSFTSDPIDIRDLDGYMSFGWVITGDGTAKIEVLHCLDGTNFLDLSTDLATGQTKTSGVGGSNGVLGTSIAPAPLVKIKVTETGGASSITVTLYAYGR